MPSGSGRASTPPRLFLFALALFFVSGATGLVYEVIWLRMLGLIFGVTAQAAATVLAVLFAGFAIGAYLAGRALDRMLYAPAKDADGMTLSQRAPALAFYAVIEATIGLYGLATPFVFSAAQHLLIPVWRTFGVSGVLPTSAGAAVAFGILVVPAALLGATLPALSRFLLSDTAEVGRKVGALYSANTWGGVVGCIALTFFVIPGIGVRNTITIAGCANILLGACAFAGYLWTRRRAGEIPASAPSPVVEDERPDALRRWGLAVAGVSGFTALGYEVLWTRAIILPFGSDIYAFATILATFLVGIASGSAIASAVVESARLKGASKHLLLCAAVLEGVIGISAILLIVGFGRLPAAMDYAVCVLGHNWGTWVLIKFTLAFALMIVPTTLLGMVFPLSCKIAASRLETIGSDIGGVYAANTICAMAGSMIAGFLLIPVFGLTGGIRMLALVNLMFTALAAWCIGKSKAWAVAAGAILLAGGLCALLVPGWDRTAMTLGRMITTMTWFEEHDDAPKEANFSSRLAGAGLIFYREGTAATVAVVEQGKARFMLVNGKVVASNVENGELRPLGHFPMLMCKSPKKVLVIGLGTGITVSSVAAHHPEELTCVELSPEVVAACPLFATENNHILQNKSLNLVIGDGRHYLLASREKYDVITSDPIHPWVAGSVNLYTREHYELCRRRLAEGGVACQWLPLGEISPEEAKAAVRTFCSVFPHSMGWLTAGSLILVGSEREFDLDPARIEERLTNPPVREGMLTNEVGTAYEFLGMLTLGDETMTGYAGEGPIVSDNHPGIEYTIPKSLCQGADLSVIREILEWRPKTLRALLAQTHVAGDEEKRLKYYYGRAGANLWVMYRRTSQAFYVGMMYARRGAAQNAILFLQDAVKSLPEDAPAHLALGAMYTDLRDFDRAEEHLRRAVSLDPTMDRAYEALAWLHSAQGRFVDALSAAEKAGEMNPWSAGPHLALGHIYGLLRKYDLAAREYRLVLQIAPGNPRAERALRLLQGR